MASEKGQRAIQLMPTMTNSAIAKEVGLSPERVRQLRSRHEIPGPHRVYCNILWTENKLGELVSLSKTGRNVREVADKLGVSRNAIRTIKKKYNIKGFSRNSKYTKDFIQTLYDKHDGHISNMAKELGVPSSGISRTCTSYGLKGMGHKAHK